MVINNRAELHNMKNNFGLHIEVNKYGYVLVYDMQNEEVITFTKYDELKEIVCKLRQLGFQQIFNQEYDNNFNLLKFMKDNFKPTNYPCNSRFDYGTFLSYDLENLEWSFSETGIKEYIPNIIYLEINIDYSGLSQNQVFEILNRQDVGFLEMEDVFKELGWS